MSRKRDTFLLFPDRSPFGMVPMWLLSEVSPRAVVLYAYISRRAGDDGWTWFRVADFIEDTSPITTPKFRALCDELGAIGAVAAFKIHASGPAERGGGRNWGWGFYRPRQLEVIELPVELEIPTRVDRGKLTPIDPRVTCRVQGSDIVRTVADGARKPRAVPPVVPGRGGQGRFVPAAQDASSRVLEGLQDASTDRDQNAWPRIHREDPAKDPCLNETPSREIALDEAVIEALAKRGQDRMSASEGAA